ncbi:MAG: Translation initiation factor IF-2 [Candidatus Alkanophagales archaeon MCA70_species_1]|nr:Translation initiation factor IF-2 [Candidatus Alkanophaga volatiphilum]
MSNRGGSKKKVMRTPIVAVLGHIDHGKTTLLDNIRGTAIAQREAGGITQHIGATEIPISVIKKICGPLLDVGKIEVSGLLFIDTPGHQAFTSLRKRGGALADLAVLIVDIMEGFQPQTYESLHILRTFKTPFVVALNKIDRIRGWRSEKKPFVLSYKEQSDEARRFLDEKVYEIVGTLYDEGFSAERYDRIRDFTRTVAIIPISAKTGEGIPDLLMVLIGLAQRFLEESLQLHVEAEGVGVVLEKKEERGIGTTIDVILYDGTLSVGDTIIIGSLDRSPIVTKVRGLLKPRALREMRAESKFERVRSVTAAAGVKIIAPNLESVLTGSQLRVVKDETRIEDAIKEMQAELEELRIETAAEGVVIKADTLGALEALASELQRENISIMKAEVGNISKRDVIDAATVKEKDPNLGVIIGFNVDVLPDAREMAQQSDIPIFLGDVIYKVIEDYVSWARRRREEEMRKALEALIIPGKFMILPDYVFRQSKPAIVGVRVLGGRIKPGAPLMRADGVAVGSIKEIQDRGNNIPEARQGMEVAVSIIGPTVGRQIKEQDILYVDVPESHIGELEKFKEYLTDDEKETLEEIKEIKASRAAARSH